MQRPSGKATIRERHGVEQKSVESSFPVIMSKLGQDSRKRPQIGESCSYKEQANVIVSCAEEDRSGAEGAMGESQGGEEDGLDPWTAANGVALDPHVE
jgi:hypothetical protein